MRGALKPLLAVALVGLLASVFPACGDDDSGAESAATATSESTATTDDRGAGGEGSEGSGSSAQEGSAGFRTPGGDNSIQNYGKEADAAELEAAAAVLSGYMDARASDRWAKECAYLARATIEPFERLASRSPRFKGKGCATILAALSSRLPASTRANTMTGGIASLRVEGERGFALYHGTEGVDYFMPMLKEGGAWKVGSLAPSEFP